jgi:hypothetical protein
MLPHVPWFSAIVEKEICMNANAVHVSCQLRGAFAQFVSDCQSTAPCVQVYVTFPGASNMTLFHYTLLDLFQYSELDGLCIHNIRRRMHIEQLSMCFTVLRKYQRGYKVALDEPSGILHRHFVCIS